MKIDLNPCAYCPQRGVWRCQQRLYEKLKSSHIKTSDLFAIMTDITGTKIKTFICHEAVKRWFRYRKRNIKI